VFGNVNEWKDLPSEIIRNTNCALLTNGQNGVAVYEGESPEQLVPVRLVEAPINLVGSGDRFIARCLAKALRGAFDAGMVRQALDRLGNPEDLANCEAHVGVPSQSSISTAAITYSISPWLRSTNGVCSDGRCWS
jgi:hypothetical protein